MTTGFAYARCGCGWSQYAGRERQHEVDKATAAHMRGHHRAGEHQYVSESGMTTGSGRPEVCPECQELVCDDECPLAAFMGWPTEHAPEAHRLDGRVLPVTAYVVRCLCGWHALAEGMTAAASAYAEHRASSVVATQ